MAHVEKKYLSPRLQVEILGVNATPRPSSSSTKVGESAWPEIWNR